MLLTLKRQGIIYTTTVLLGVLLISACTTAAVTRQVAIEGDYVTFSGRWSTTGTAQPGGYQSIAVKLIEVDGIMEVCGAWAHEGTSGREASYRSMYDTMVLVNGTPVLKDISFMSKVRSISALKGAAANCASTGISMPKGKLDIDLERIGSGRYRV